MNQALCPRHRLSQIINIVRCSLWASIVDACQSDLPKNPIETEVKYCSIQLLQFSCIESNKAIYLWRVW